MLVKLKIHLLCCGIEVYCDVFGLVVSAQLHVLHVDDLTQVHKCLTFCLPDTVHSFEICEYHSLAGYFYLMHAFLQSNTGSL